MSTFSLLKNQWKKETETNPYIRFGQWFVNNYIKGQWPELFYGDEKLADLLIQQWLIDFQYTDTLPSVIQR